MAMDAMGVRQAGRQSRFRARCACVPNAGEWRDGRWPTTIQPTLPNATHTWLSSPFLFPFSLSLSDSTEFVRIMLLLLLVKGESWTLRRHIAFLPTLKQSPCGIGVLGLGLALRGGGW
jgi:hypothetical protein